MLLRFFYLFNLHLGRNHALRNWLNLMGYFLESETLIFSDIVWDFYFSGDSIIRYFFITADFTVDEKYY